MMDIEKQLKAIDDTLTKMLMRIDKLEELTKDKDEESTDLYSDNSDIQVEFVDLNNDPRAGSFLEGLLSRMGGQSEEHECLHAKMLREQGERFKSILEERDAEIERLQLVIETLEDHIAESNTNEKD